MTRQGHCCYSIPGLFYFHMPMIATDPFSDPFSLLGFVGWPFSFFQPTPRKKSNEKSFYGLGKGGKGAFYFEGARNIKRSIST